MSWTEFVEKAMVELGNEASALEKQRDEVRRQIAELERFGRTFGGRVPFRRSRLSAEGRAAISRAAKKRWAAYRRSRVLAHP